MISGAATLTLEQARPRITQAHPIEELPNGARVIVDVGRSNVEQNTATYLHKHAQRLDIDLRAHPDVIGDWMRAVRDPDGYYAERDERWRQVWGSS